MYTNGKGEVLVMRYEGTVYRPPSEAYSLIIQATIGCSHNKCSFCSMYKNKNFKIRPINDILEDLNMARTRYKRVEKIFLADGDALIIKTENLLLILKEIQKLFPECKRVGVYGSPKSILAKTNCELEILRENGLKIIYLGVESGSDFILNNINKGVDSNEIIEAGEKVKQNRITLSVTLISGLGGKENLEEHAIESAKVINRINPDYLGVLTLMIEPQTELEVEVKEGRFNLLTPREVMLEMKLLIENLQLNGTVFRSNHASNYINLGGTFPIDKGRLLEDIKYVLNNNDLYKNEKFRGL